MVLKLTPEGEENKKKCRVLFDQGEHPCKGFYEKFPNTPPSTIRNWFKQWQEANAAQTAQAIAAANTNLVEFKPVVPKKRSIPNLAELSDVDLARNVVRAIALDLKAPPAVRVQACGMLLKAAYLRHELPKNIITEEEELETEAALEELTDEPQELIKKYREMIN